MKFHHSCRSCTSPLRPMEFPEEQQFFDWLGVEEMCRRPQLVLQRLSSAQGVIHPFLQDGTTGRRGGGFFTGEVVMGQNPGTLGARSHSW